MAAKQPATRRSPTRVKAGATAVELASTRSRCYAILVAPNSDAAASHSEAVRSSRFHL